MKASHTSIKLIFLFLIFSTSVCAQNAKIDSLNTELQNHLEKDTLRVNLLNDLAFSIQKMDELKTQEYLEEATTIANALAFEKGKARSLFVSGSIQHAQSNYEKAISAFKKALLLYEKVNYQIGVSDCYKGMGLSSHFNGDFQESIAFYKKSIAIDEELGDIKDTALSFKYIGFNFVDIGSYEEAFPYYQKALNINIEYGNTLEISNCYMNMGSIHLKKANYPAALEFYNRSLEISEKIKDTLGISKVLNNIGIIYKNYENFDKAIENYEKSLIIQKKIGSQRNISKALGNLGTVYMRKEDFTMALRYYNEALVISKEVNDKDSQSRYLNNIGLVYSGLKDDILARKYYNEGKEIALEIGDQNGLCSVYFRIAETYSNQKEYKKALINALESRKIADKLGLLYFQTDINELLSTIYSNTGQYEKALSSHQQFKILNDSLFNKGNIQKIAQLESEYKYKRALDSASIRELKLTKTVQVTSQDLEKSQRSFLWTIIGFLLVSILLGGIIFYLKFRNIKSETQNIIIEQKLLRSQMTPHFIFNSLSVLQGMILNKEERKSVLYLSKFSKLLRIILENSRDKMVLLSQELAAIENYLALQNLENEAYSYTVYVSEKIDVSLIEIPPMLIQPFVENAIEHAFGNQNENREIDVRLTYIDNKLICNIIDNGIGINFPKKNDRKDKSSLATTITSERLKVLSKEFKMKGSVCVEDRQKDSKQGTKVTLVIPYAIRNEIKNDSKTI